MGNWGVSSNASDKEKLISEYADYLNGLNCVGKISYEVYLEMFDFGIALLDKMYELSNKDTKIKVTSADIIVHMISDKPYYEIKYLEVDSNEYHIGYSSYELRTVLKWLNECFEIVN